MCMWKRHCPHTLWLAYRDILVMYLSQRCHDSFFSLLSFFVLLVLTEYRVTHWRKKQLFVFICSFLSIYSTRCFVTGNPALCPGCCHDSARWPYFTWFTTSCVCDLGTCMTLYVNTGQLTIDPRSPLYVTLTHVQYVYHTVVYCTVCRESWYMPSQFDN